MEPLDGMVNEAYMDPSSPESKAHIASYAPEYKLRDAMEPRIVKAWHDRPTQSLALLLSGGATLLVPLAKLPELAGASPEDLDQLEVWPMRNIVEFTRLDHAYGVLDLVLRFTGSAAWRRRVLLLDGAAYEVARETGRQGGLARSAAKAKAAQVNGKKGGRPRKTPKPAEGAALEAKPKGKAGGKAKGSAAGRGPRKQDPN